MAKEQLPFPPVKPAVMLPGPAGDGLVVVFKGLMVMLAVTCGAAL